MNSGPLAQQFAQVLASFEKLRSAGRTSDILKVWCDDGIDALSVIERHVQDMEKRGGYFVSRPEWEEFAAWKRQRVAERCEICGSTEAIDYRGWTDERSPLLSCELCGGPDTALPAREKEEE